VSRFTLPRSQIKRLKSLVGQFQRTRLLVIGDLILDQFIWGKVNRISPEAPVPVVQVTSESYRLGGAANVVHNIQELGGKASLCGVIGTDAVGRNLREELVRMGISLDGVVTSSHLQTTHKVRIIAHNQQIVRLDRENSHGQDSTARRRIRDFVRQNYGEFDGVVISDYGKGVVDSSLLVLMQDLRQKTGLLCVVDPKRTNFDLYSSMTLITPNEAEAETASGIEIHDEKSLLAAGARLVEKWKPEAVLITRGEKGMSLFENGRNPKHIPTAARQVYDVTGAGDTVLAICSLGLAAGGGFADVAMLANVAAGVVVGEVGTVAISRHALLGALTQ
jgi:D-beta-D-heptose 7-phosphate kinase/D-beta-D-heptose 1-phosphate adenosyltransferase